MKEFVIDLFCGAGGTSEGIHLSNSDSKVVACVNHDAKAIASHTLNHPHAKHFIEDIRNPEVVFLLKLRVNALRKKYPDCVITIWASLECTNFSNAKGGMPRDADSRTLAEHLFMYLDALDPEYLMIENVVEFMAWGPLDDKGKPVSRKRGEDYLKWINNVKSYGYRYDWKELNSADYGAYTARNRFFAQFAKTGYPIAWPDATHAKNPLQSDGLFSNSLKKWKAVKEVLDFEVEGQSIFNRKKPLVENTLKRIYAGLVKFVANGDDTFIQRYYSGNDMQRNHSINEPAGVVRTNNCLALVNTEFLTRSNGGNPEHRVSSVETPLNTLTTSPNNAKVKAEFLQSYYGNGMPHSTDEPCPTVTTKDRFSKVDASFIDQQYGNSKPSSVNDPVGALTINPKFAKVNYLMMNYSSGQKVRSVDYPAATVVQSDKHNLIEAEHFIFNPQYTSKGHSVEKPCPVIIARQDKAPLGLVICEHADGFAIPIYEDDTVTMVKIKQFMAYYGIIDIKMRMLMVRELLQIQGFPADYQLVGNQTDQKKFIGNSVEVNTAKALFNAHGEGLKEYLNKLQNVA